LTQLKDTISQMYGGIHGTPLEIWLQKRID